VPPGAIHSPWHLPFIDASFHFSGGCRMENWGAGGTGGTGKSGTWSDKQAAGDDRVRKTGQHKHCTS